MNRKFLPVFLAFFLLLQAGGLWIFLKSGQIYHKFQVHTLQKNRSQSGDFMVLSIETYENSLVEENEISIDGRMYDVRSINMGTDSVELRVIEDVFETQLIQTMLSVEQSGNGQNIPSEIPLFWLIRLAYLPPNQPEPEQAIFCSTRTWMQHEEAVCSTFKRNQTPPPEMI